MMDGLEVQLLAKLGIVLLLIFPTLWGLRRLLGAQTAGGWRKAIHVLETQSLGEGQRLYLVRVHGRHLLLGGCKESLSLLTEMEAPQEPEVVATNELKWDGAARLFTSAGGRRLAWLSERLRVGRPEAL